MEHWTETEELKDAASVRRRQEDKSSVEDGLTEGPDFVVETLDDIARLPADAASIFVKHLDDAKCAALSQSLPRLQVLDQDGSPGALTDEGVAALASLGELRTLSLEWATGLTDRSIENLRRLTRLEFLDLEFSGISGEAIRELGFALPNCEILPAS